MKRCVFARHAGSYITSSRFLNLKVSLSNSNLLLLQSTTSISSPSSSSSSSSWITRFRHFSYLSNNPRYFSLITHPAPPEENGVVQNDYDVKEEVHEIDAKQLENVLILLQNNADGSLESCLNSMHLTLHQHFVLKIIETCCNRRKLGVGKTKTCKLGHNLIWFIKWARKKKSFKVTTPVVESLVLAIQSGGGGPRKKDMYSLWELVKEIGKKEREVLNVRILNQLIIFFSNLEDGKAALEAFDKFEVFQCVANEDTYYFTIKFLCRRLNFDQAWSVCQKMLDAECLPDGEKVGKIISWFCNDKKVKEAHAVYLAAIEKRKQLPMSCVNNLVTTLCQVNETVQLALEMLNDIPEVGKKCAKKLFSVVILALCRIKDVDAAKQLVLKMIADGLSPENDVFDIIIICYTKVGEMAQAMEMMRLSESRRLKLLVYTYTILMSGYSNAGEMEKARKILEEAKKKHSELSLEMYHTLIRGYCKLEQFEEALKLLTEMKDFGVCPNVDEYEKLIQFLCLKALDWETTEKLLEDMKEKLLEDMRENGLHPMLIRLELEQMRLALKM